jgi:hypothetical protein
MSAETSRVPHVLPHLSTCSRAGDLSLTFLLLHGRQDHLQQNDPTSGLLCSAQPTWAPHLWVLASWKQQILEWQKRIVCLPYA